MLPPTIKRGGEVKNRQSQMRRLSLSILTAIILMGCSRPLTVHNTQPTPPADSALPLIDNSDIAVLSIDQQILIKALIADLFRVRDSLIAASHPRLVFVSVFGKNPEKALLEGLEPDIHTFKPAASGRRSIRSGVFDPQTGRKGTFLMAPRAGSGWRFHFRLIAGEWVIQKKEQGLLL
jgi:hypothetical protein